MMKLHCFYRFLFLSAGHGIFPFFLKVAMMKQNSGMHYDVFINHRGPDVKNSLPVFCDVNPASLRRIAKGYRGREPPEKTKRWRCAPESLMSSRPVIQNERRVSILFIYSLICLIYKFSFYFSLTRLSSFGFSVTIGTLPIKWWALY